MSLHVTTPRPLIIERKSRRQKGKVLFPLLHNSQEAAKKSLIVKTILRS